MKIVGTSNSPDRGNHPVVQSWPRSIVVRNAIVSWIKATTIARLTTMQTIAVDIRK